MNKYFLGFCVVVCAGIATSCSTSSKVATKTTTTVDTAKAVVAIDSFAYGLGMNIGNNLKDQGVDTLDYAALQKGMMDVFNKKTTLITEQEAIKAYSKKCRNMPINA